MYKNIKRVILVSGTRNGVDEKKLFGVLDNILKKYDPLEVVLIHGNAKGVDKQADKWCKMNGVHAFKCDAMWGFYDNGSGPLRNNVMIQVLHLLNQLITVEKNNLEISVEAFPPPHEGGGTNNAIEISKELNLPVNVYK